MDNYRYRKHIRHSQETRWATMEEIKNSSVHVCLENETCPGAGLPLLSDGKDVYVDNKDTHTIIFGATGSKKTRLFCMPMLGFFIKAGESFIAADPKGELYSRTAGMAKEYGYQTIVLNFRDIGCGDMWNPLSIPYDLYHNGDTEGAVSFLNDFIRTLAAPQLNKTDDVFWPEMASSFALANMMLLMECAKKDEANVISLSRLCSLDMEEKLMNLSERMSVYSIAGMNYKNVLTAADKTRQSIYVSLYGMLRIFNTQKRLAAMLSGNTFDINSIGKVKTAVYIIVPDEKTTLHFLASVFIKQVYELLVANAQKEENKKLPVRVNFVLDEFCNMPEIPDIPSMISAARSRNMRFYLIAQSLHQLRGKYGENADTIKGNCDNWVFLTSKELDLLHEISELCGDVIMADGIRRRLISIAELQHLDKNAGEALILHCRLCPIITELADIDSYEDLKGYPALPMNQTAEPQYHIFSLDRFYDKVLEGKEKIPFLKQEGE